MPNNVFTNEMIQSFRLQVYHYFKREGRELPWRTDYNPYHILLSEIMLQQTQVDRVTGKYILFIERFPTVAALAKAPLQEVLEAWQGLGYNRRAKTLRAAAQKIVEEHNGTVPRDPEVLKKIPGIGPATAASIAAFAYNEPTVFLETNIRTVFIHHFLRNRTQVDDGAILPLAAAALDRRNPRKWYSALMDYGTMLKKEVGNLSRNSVTYKKQSPFKGSRRQLRGAILRLLIDRDGCSKVVIARQLNQDPVAVGELLDVLAGEGLLVLVGRRYRIAG